MCKFCECIVNTNKEVLWNVRNRSAEDNSCEIIVDDNCSECGGCKEYFKLYSYGKYEENTFINIEHYKKVGEVIIDSFSEGLHINYCPYCGKQLSKDIKDFDDMYPHIIEVYNLDGTPYDYEMDKFVEEVLDK